MNYEGMNCDDFEKWCQMIEIGNEFDVTDPEAASFAKKLELGKPGACREEMSPLW